MSKKLSLPALPSLRPYRSFLFLKLAVNADDGVGLVRNAIADVIPSLSGSGQPIRSPRSRKEELFTAFVAYTRERRAPWTTDPAFTNLEHHLAVASGYKNWCAVFMSDSGLREAVKAEIAENARAFSDVELIPANRLNAVFVKGRARTLWLNSVQQRNSLRADNKVLSGISLEDTLDPLGDQAYTFSAARCQNDVIGSRTTYGIAPRKSRLWFKRSKNWEDYTNTVRVLLRALDDSSAEEAAPLPVLSTPVQGTVSLQTLGEAYEISLVPPDSMIPPDQEEMDASETDGAPELNFEIVRGVPPTLTVSIMSDKAKHAGQYSLELSVRREGQVSWAIHAVKDNDEDTLRHLRLSQEHLRVSFDGGFAISEGAIHRVQYRDVKFKGFQWDAFAGIDLSKEKPAPLNKQTIGAQDSLFCWVKSQWSKSTLKWLPSGGWLASNDGALELADFIHLQEAQEPTLTLIHVKATENISASRGLAVSPYEQVISQAVKNLRHLDPQLATVEFMKRLGRQIREAVWHNGRLAARQDMLSALQAHGTNLARRVVIVQPRVRKRAYEQASVARDGTKDQHLIRQLNTLLLNAQQGCTALGAEFIVIGQDA